uniref:Transmembrane protein n=1 Tax=Heterorhabditis bacteriophora TaxID=37862 RepID=A0A1I7X9C5_HETBA
MEKRKLKENMEEGHTSDRIFEVLGWKRISLKMIIRRIILVSQGLLFVRSLWDRIIVDKITSLYLCSCNNINNIAKCEAVDVKQLQHKMKRRRERYFICYLTHLELTAQEMAHQQKESQWMVKCSKRNLEMRREITCSGEQRRWKIIEPEYRYRMDSHHEEYRSCSAETTITPKAYLSSKLRLSKRN